MKSRSSRIVIASAWLLAALGAVQTGAQQPVAPPSYHQRLDGRLDTRTLPLVEHVVDSALAAGLPAEPLVDRALEGSAKNASGEVIVREVRKLAADLAIARQALGLESRSVELTAGALALRSGVAPDALKKLRTDRPGQPLSVPLGVLTGLIASGVPVPTATKTILDLTKNGIADEQLVAFRRDVERDVGMGASPATAVVVNGLSLDRTGGGSAPPGGADARPAGKRRP